MLSEYIQGVNNGLDVVSQNDSISFLLWSMIPEFLCHLSVELTWTTSCSWYLVHCFINFVLLKGWCFWVAEIFEWGDDFIELRHWESKRF